MVRLVAAFIDNPYVGSVPKYYDSIKEANEVFFNSIQHSIEILNDNYYYNAEKPLGRKYEAISTSYDEDEAIANYIAYIIYAYSDDAKALAVLNVNSMIERRDRVNYVNFNLSDKFVPANLLINVTPDKVYRVRGIDKDFILAYSIGIRKVFLHPCANNSSSCGEEPSVVNASPRMIGTFMHNESYRQLIERMEKKTLLQTYTHAAELFIKEKTDFTLIKHCTLLDQMSMLDKAEIPYYLEAVKTGIKLYVMGNDGTINEFMTFDVNGEILTLK